MRYFAILKDSFLEAVDRKSLYVMMIVSAVFILILGGFSYSPLDPAGAIQDLARRFDTVLQVRLGSFWHETYPVGFEIRDFKALGDDAGTFAGGYAFTLEAAPVKEFHRLARHWDATERGLVRAQADPVPDLDVEAPPDLELKFLKGRFAEAAMQRREVIRTDVAPDRRVFAVRIKPSSPKAIDGAWQIHMLYGAWTLTLPISVSRAVFNIEHLLSEWFAGLAGIMIALIFTSWSIPGMLQKGSLDVLLSKPVRRPVLLLYKYLGGLTYASISGGVFIGGSWLVLSARSGVWNWGYLASLATLIFFFAVLYSIGTLTAVLTRSPVASILVPSLAWLAGSAVNFMKNWVLNPMFALDAPPSLRRGLEWASWLLPRAGDINQMNSWFMLKGAFGSDVDAMAAQMNLADVEWARSMGSSALLIAAMLSLACWIFSRRDY